MTFPIRHKLLTIGGTAYGGSEEWQFGMRIIPEIAEQEVTQAQVDSLATPITTFWNDGTIFMPSSHSLTFAKLAPIAQDGKYPPGEVAFEHVFTADPGPGAVQRQIAQAALAVTLQTSVPRGRGHAGRFYLPAPASQPDTLGVHSTALAVAVATSVRTLVNSINAAANVGTVGVLSSLGFGTSRVVVSIRVGVRPDVIRRRARQLPENYQTVVL